MAVSPEFLLKDEIVFELKIRDIDVQGVLFVLKERLSKAIKESAPICRAVYDNYDPNFEVQLIAESIENIRSVLQKGITNAKYLNEIHHLYNRLYSLWARLKDKPDIELSNQTDKLAIELNNLRISMEGEESRLV